MSEAEVRQSVPLAKTAKVLNVVGSWVGVGRLSGRRRRGGLLNNVSANIKKNLDSSRRRKAKPRIRGGGGLGLSHLSGPECPHLG